MDDKTAEGDGTGKDALARIVEGLAAIVAGDGVPEDMRLLGELARLALLIAEAKREIAGLAPEEISGLFIPQAQDELDAIVGATEAAADSILDAAESIEAALSGLPAAAADPIRGAVTHIYEACNFQDITGQRIAK